MRARIWLIARRVFVHFVSLGHLHPPPLPDSDHSITLPLPCDGARGIGFQIYLRVVNGWMVLAGLRDAVVQPGGWVGGWVRWVGG